MKVKLVLFFALLLSSGFLYSQNPIDSENRLLEEGDYSFMNSRPMFGVQVGSNFLYGYGRNMFSQSVAPHFTFKPGQKFSIVAGSIFSTSSFAGMTAGYSGGSSPDRFLSTTVYALGAYHLDPRLTLTGGVWAERNNMNAMFFGAGQQMNPQALDFNAKGMIMGLDYKISDHLRFGAIINFSNAPNHFNPYMNRGLYHQQNPFYNGNGW